MLTLYELTDEFLQLQQMLEDGEADEQLNMIWKKRPIITQKLLETLKARLKH